MTTRESIATALLLYIASAANAAGPTPRQLEFFENHIRPVLAKHCYECHNSGDTAEGGLALDHRAALRKGGDTGAAIVPGKPDESLLLKLVRHEVDGLEMPQGGEKLPEDAISKFAEWITMGAPDPRDKPPSAGELATATSWEAILAKRKEWWSFQPLRKPPLPAVRNTAWSAHPVDRFILARLEAEGLSPGPLADRATLLRRLCFALTGLPPTIEQVDAFEHDERPDAYERVVDELLDSEAFGERWARHWMDWVRYADSHGSEGDPAIPHAYQYRDYLIRALNADVPYDQLVREHIAGDLLPAPRLNEDLGINESAIGPAHWRMVFHGFAPTDALDEKVRFTDDQINVFSKAFLGLTVSCARCHDHKFDAISQQDYYALFGILGSTRPATIDVNTQARRELHRRELTDLKTQLRETLAEVWTKAADDVAAQLLDPTGNWKTALDQAQDTSHVLYPCAELIRVAESPEAFASTWSRLREAAVGERRNWQAHQQRDFPRRWNLANERDYRSWFRAGAGACEEAPQVGEFTVSFEGEQIVERVLPSGFHSHGLSTRHRAVLSSPRLSLAGEYDLWLRVAGDGDALARYVVQNYPRSGTVYPVTTLNGGHWRWQKYDLSYWDGDQIHLEFNTAPDTAVLVKNNDRSWFGVREALLVRRGEAGPPSKESAWRELMLSNKDADPPASTKEFGEHFVGVLREAIAAWRRSETTDSQALFLDGLLSEGLLPNRLEDVVDAAPLLAEYRSLEADIPLPTRVPGLMEADAADQPLFIRGDHHQPGESVPRRFLEAIDPTPYASANSGRLELARDVVRADNPLTSRVAVNRLWHYLFGQGIVPTTDNFGRLGETPSHPELLDYLAARFMEHGWSMKETIRFLVLSKTWRLDSRPSPEAQRLAPANRLLSHANLRRLDAEAIRDALLAVAGRLDRTMYGPGVAANSAAARRSVYVRVLRNSLDELLGVFDAPVPFATQGRRDVTNVPAQSLTMLNDPLIIKLAGDWATSVEKTADSTAEEQRIAGMFRQALSREPTTSELTSLTEFVRSLSEQYRATGEWQAQRNREIEERRSASGLLLESARQRLAASNKPSTETTSSTTTMSEVSGPKPISRWSFEENLNDGVGQLHGTSHGSARLENGALVLDGRSHVATAPLKQDLQAKTLEAWVLLDGLQQSGGGVISVQDVSGGVFDAIVYAERRPRRWLAGSNNFARTNDFGGVDETAADQTPVHVAIVYEADGTIRGYRNGEPYGRPYRKSAAVAFPTGKSQVLFGLRHGAPGGNRLLKGRILEARLYDFALSDEQIAESAASLGGGITMKQLVASFTDAQRKQYDQLQSEIKRLETERKSLGSAPGPQQAWADLAHAIFNLKEFIYLR